MQDTLPALVQDQEPKANLFLRHDTIFGVCQGLGEEFGFNPNFLRVPFAAGILWNPLVVFGAYLALGCALAFARWMYPKPRASTAAPQLAAGQQPAATADNADAELSIAA